MSEIEKGINIDIEKLLVCVRFGGKIKVSCGDIDNSVIVGFQELDKIRNVGDKHYEDWDYEKPTALLMFDDIKSIEIVEESLQIAKDILKEKINSHA